MEEVAALKLSLHGKVIAYLIGFNNGRNVLHFSKAFTEDNQRPTFSLITHPNFPRSEKLLQEPWSRQHRLHPSLSNLLPEGALRELIAQGLKVHTENEFQLLSYLGQDLPGALIAEPISPENTPDELLYSYKKVKNIQYNNPNNRNKFSLAGVQMKFSMKEKDGRYNLSNNEELGDWIVKTPSTQHKDVPQNEYSTMTLAALAGVDIPEVKLVDLNKLSKLPQINLPDEKYAFAIKRFDRNNEHRIHTEDFAQVLVKYPHDKYNAANYEQIGKIIYQYSEKGLNDAQQLARRLLINILLANGDAHLKNWSLIYPDQRTPRLSPAYDILTTRVYIENEQHFALNLGKNKGWYKASLEHFEAWAKKADIPWRAIKPQLKDTLEKARSLWPKALQDLPMNEGHKESLTAHWGRLDRDFKF